MECPPHGKADRRRVFSPKDLCTRRRHRAASEYIGPSARKKRELQDDNAGETREEPGDADVLTVGNGFRQNVDYSLPATLARWNDRARRLSAISLRGSVVPLPRNMGPVTNISPEPKV